jgi:hypothetical protein
MRLRRVQQHNRPLCKEPKMSLTKTGLPPVDAAVPAVLETATFALG